MSKLQTPGPKLKSNDGKSTVNAAPKKAKATKTTAKKKADVKDKGEEPKTDAAKLAAASTPAEAAKVGSPGLKDITPEEARKGAKGETMVPPSVIYPIRDDLPQVRDTSTTTRSGPGKAIWDEEMGNGWRDYAEGKDRTEEYRRKGNSMRKEAYIKGREHAAAFAKLPKYGEGGDLSEDDIVTTPATKVEEREAA